VLDKNCQPVSVFKNSTPTNTTQAMEEEEARLEAEIMELMKLKSAVSTTKQVLYRCCYRAC
jgi:hypothetical protein